MASERTKELYKVLLNKGYPKDFCAEVAYRNMNTDYTATRMLGYLYRYTNPRIEDLVDEMLAILSDRNQIIEKKESEHAQAVISEMYRNGLVFVRKRRSYEKKDRVFVVIYGNRGIWASVRSDSTGSRGRQ